MADGQDDGGAMREEWRPVVGYEGRYEVSNDGRVRSFARSRYGRELAPFDVHGYRRIRLRGADGRVVQVGVHRLVLMAFDRRPVGEEQARHLNDNKADNRIENLAWGSQADNWGDRKRNGINPFGNKTHCAHGHPYDEANTVWCSDKAGRLFRGCRICRIANRARHKRTKVQCATCGRRVGKEYLRKHAEVVHREVAA